MTIKQPTKLNAISTFMIASLFSASAAAAPLALEGPIQAIAADGTSMTVMGVTVAIPATALISSPTKALTLGELADTTTLPGRSQAGFIGGTAIINGLTANDPANITGLDIAEDVFVEPAENVLLGEVSSQAPFSISGVKMVQLTDGRIPAGAAIDANGLIIDLATAPVGSAAAAEGYFGFAPDGTGVFYYFLVEAEGLPIGCAGRGCRPADAVSIARSRCRDDDEIRVQGGVADVDGQLSASVTIVNFGTAPVIFDPATGEATYSFRDDINGNCPATVTVNYNLAVATTDVDIR
jgi:hypothetical protein